MSCMKRMVLLVMQGYSTDDVERMQLFFVMPLAEAAEKMGVGHTVLKRQCRNMGIKRWPSRPLAAVTGLLNHAAKQLDEMFS